MQSVITSLTWWEPPPPRVSFFLAVVFSHLPTSESSKLVSQDREPLRSIPLRDIQKVHECLVKSGWVKREWLNLPPCCLVPTIALAKACVLNGRWMRGKCDYTQQEVSTQTLHKIKGGLIVMDKKKMWSTLFLDTMRPLVLVVWWRVLSFAHHQSSLSRHLSLLAWTPLNSLSPPVKGADFSAWMITYLDLLPLDQPAVVAGRPTHA